MFKIKMPECILHLYGDWINVNKEGPKLSEEGEMLATWMNKGSKIKAVDIHHRVAEYRKLLSDDPTYLKARIDKMLEDLELMEGLLTLNEMAWKEFKAQEYYRNSIKAGLNRIVQTFRAECQKGMTQVHSPQKPEEQFQHGRNIGMYETFAKCAQYVQDIVDQAALAVATEDMPEEKKE